MVYKLEGHCFIKKYSYRTDGIIIFNEKGENYVISVDTEQQCCEDFIFEHIDKNVILGSYAGTEISDNGVEIIVEEDKNFVCECGAKYIVKIIGDIRTYKFVISNDHNGFYSHEIKIYNGKLLWKEWI